jgi:hypothetical protein
MAAASVGGFQPRRKAFSAYSEMIGGIDCLAFSAALPQEKPLR